MTDLEFTVPRGYAADWALFTDWCAATDHVALPAAPATSVAFLQENRAAPHTHRRRVTAINRIHLEHGHQPPGADPAVRDWLTQQLGQPERADRRPVRAVVDEAIARIPVGGWPTGLFGRRDALLVLLRHRAGLTHRQLADLTSNDLTIDVDQCLHIGIGGGQVLAPADDPAVCPACIWRRWRTLLRLATRYTTTGRLAELLGPAEASPSTHACQRPSKRGGPTQPVPVFPPIDRWGSVPLPLRPTTIRSSIALTGQHLSDRPPVHPTVVDSTAASELLIGPPEPRMPVLNVAATYEQTYAAGLAARREALEELAEAGRALDAVDAMVDALNARVAELDRWIAGPYARSEY
ncbi:hypothetical protein SAMN04515671_1650 [Nakamurella panacisegetis]|uniref:Phage integrase family protein n=1 Tax=Nakamurella panacisegetis TaxID=1090615 RepID=A0A1H0LFI2_9ACTN|nr:hypothetical protein [Nakamurella panacisegetis]SDO66958.1 hypothetical protein SAMN04515671_1650 [Nakamurella panacisegetis]